MKKEELERQLTLYQFLKDILKLSRECGLSFEEEVAKELEKVFNKIKTSI